MPFDKLSQLTVALCDKDQAEKKLNSSQMVLKKLEAKQKHLDIKHAKKIKRLTIEKQRMRR